MTQKYTTAALSKALRCTSWSAESCVMENELPLEFVRLTCAGTRFGVAIIAYIQVGENKNSQFLVKIFKKKSKKKYVGFLEDVEAGFFIISLFLLIISIFQKLSKIQFPSIPKFQILLNSKLSIIFCRLEVWKPWKLEFQYKS